MDKNESEPIEPDVENSQNKFFIFHLHKKLAIILFIGLLFLVLSVGAYYTKRNDTIRPNQINIIIPTNPILPTTSNQNNNLLISPTPTITPIENYECKTNADCGGEYTCQNDDSSNCFWTSECINNTCKEKSLDNRRINAFPACQNDNDCLPRNGCFLYKCMNNECRKINMCTGE